MRRTAAWKPIGIVAAASIAIAGFGVAPATAAEDDPEQALARVLGSSLLDQGLLGAATAYTGTSETPNPASNDLTLDSELLGLTLDVPGGLQLPLIDDGTNNGLLALGEAGTLSSYAATTPDSSIAASGLISSDGAIAVDPDPAPGTPPAAVVDLTQVLDQLGVAGLTDQIVSELRLELGAFAARAQTDGTTIDDQYALADLRLEFDSPTVAALASGLTADLATITTALDSGIAGLGGPGGTLQQVFNALDLELSLLGINVLGVDASGGTAEVNVANLTETVRTLLDDDLSTPDIELIADGVTINLTSGTISLDLAQIVNPTGQGLNGLDPNTPVLDDALISGVVTSVTTLLGGLTGNLSTALTTALNGSSINLSIPLSITSLLGTVATATVTVEGTLAQFLAGQGTVDVVDADVLGLGDLLGIDLGALVSGLLDLVTGPVLGLLGGLVTGLVTDATDGITDSVADLGTAVTGVLGELDFVFDALTDVAAITVNAQPTVATPPTVSDLGPDGFTVHALQIVLLPGLTGGSLAAVTLGSASVLNVDAAPAGTLEIDPNRVHAGDTVDLTGEDWDPAGGDVTVTFRNAGGTQIGTTETLPVSSGGTIFGDYTVPPGTAPGTLTATAAQANGVQTTATLEVVADPTVIVDPNPVDPGETITITGSGFLCGPVTVTITGGPEPVVIPNIPVDANGAWSTTYPVPADLDATTLIITAVATGTCDDEAETPVDVDQPETIDLSPGEVRGGDDVAIDGDGWDETGGPVTVVFTDDDGNQVGDPVVIPVGPGGTIEGSFPVPPGTPAGDLTGTATQGDDSTTDTVAVFDPASVSVDPSTVRAGAEVDVTGGGWLPSGGDVTVTFRDGTGATVGTPVVTTPTATGTIADTFTVPSTTDAGTLVATAVQGDATALDTLVVAPEPSVTVTPDTARPGSLVTVGGEGWNPAGGPVSVVFTDEDGAQVGDALSLIPGTDGVISGPYTVPGDAEEGTLTATATQGADTDTAELEITLAPTVTATPPQIHAGDDIVIAGEGWAPGTVTVTVTDGVGTIGTAIDLVVSAEGTISGTYPVPEGTDPGTLTVVAEQGADTATDTVELVADPTVEVEPNPADPGQQVTITGSGFLCGPVTVTISGVGFTPVVFEGVTVTNGTWTQTWTVPADIAVDSLTITAVATGTCDDEGETELEVDLDETLTASPEFVEVGDVVTVAGTGWDDGAVTITATDASGQTRGIFLATAVDGAFSVPYTVPNGTVLGALEFEATQGDDVETATVSVIAIPAGPASIIVSPSTVEAGATVAIDGEGFDPTGGTVTITITDAADGPVGSVLAAVQPDGALFTAAFQVPATVTPQTLTATAVQGPRTATDTFDVRESNLPVVRLGGPDRFATAVEISRDAFPFGADIVYLANGLKFPDALSAAPAAAQTDSPLLLTRQGYLEPGVIDEFDRLEPDVVVIVGDENSVSDAVAQQVAPFAGEIVRLGGDDRFETSQLIAEYAFESASTAYVATGLNFPDALTAGAAAGADGAPLLLTYGATPPPGFVDTLQGLGVEGVFIAGDGNAVATSQEAVIEAAGIEILDRYAGANRFDTGIQVSQASFDGPAARIYVATGSRFPDALAGSAIAGAQNVPVFVSRMECMWADILDERDRLGGPQVVLLGDQLALDNNVFDLVPCTG